MPKIVTPSLRNGLSLDGLVNKHDAMLDQPLLTTSNVTFNNLELTGDLTVEGNTLIRGQQTILETQIVRTKDALIEVNYDNTSALSQGGILVNRGLGLMPALIVWDEASQTVQVGVQGSLRPIAYRSTTNVDGGLIVWDEATKTMTSTTTVGIDTTFNGNLFVKQGLALGSSSSPPFVTGDSIGNLVFQSNSNIRFSIGNSTGQVVLVGSTKLNLGGQTIYGDTSGILYLNAVEYRLQQASKIGWNTANYITESQDGNTMRFVAPTLEFAASHAISLPVPLNFGNTGSISAETGNVLQITSTGDISFVLGPYGVVRLPSLSIANNMVQFLTDSVGNMTLQTSGDMTLSPLANIFVPSGKKLVFSTTDKSIRGALNGDLIVSSGYNIVFNSTGNVVVSSQLQVGNNTIVNESGSGDTIIGNSSGNILLQPSSGSGHVAVPSGTHLLFSSSESVYSNGQNMYFVSGLDIVFSASRNLVVPQNKLLSFGNTSNGVVLNSSGILTVTANSGLLLNTNVTLGGTLTWQASGSTITDNSSLGTLTLSAPSSVVSSVPFVVSSTASGTSLGSGSLNVSGSLVSSGTIVGQSGGTFTGTIVGAGGAFTASNVAGNPVVTLQNQSTTIGAGISFSSKWDSTNGYVIGHGTSTLNSGRVLSFTVPDYATGYSSTGARPSMYFGTTSNWILTLTDTLTALRSGDFLISSTSSTALQVAGTIQAGSIVAVSLSVPSVVSIDTSAGVQANKMITANAGLQALSANTSAVNFSVTDAGGIIANLPLYANGVSVFGASATFNDVIVASSNLTVHGTLSVSGNRLQNVGTPSAGTDAANKTYVDLMAQGMSFKSSVTAATTGGINLSNPVYGLDSITLAPAMRVLVKDQSNAIENGIYVVNSDFTLSRAVDFNVGDRAAGSIVFVTEGATFGNEGFIVSGSNLTIGTDSIHWTSFIGLDVIDTGTALTKSGNVLSVLIDNVSIETDGSNHLRLASGAVGLGLAGGSGTAVSTSSNQSHVTQIGTITQGTWHGSVLGLAYGGTGLTSVFAGQVLLGGTSSALKTGNLFYNDTLNRFGVGTVSPVASLEVSEATSNATLQLTSSNSTPQQSGIVLKQTGGPVRQSQFSMLTDGTLLVSQDDTGTDSRIVFATGGGNPRMVINSQGQVLVGTNSPDGNNILTVGGGMSISGNTTVAGSLVLGGYATLSSHPTFTSDLLLTTGTLHLTGGFQAASNSNVGNMQFITSSSSTTILSSNLTTGLSLPLNLAQSGSFISATAYSSGFHVPSVLLIGGTYADQTTGYRAQLVSNNLHFTPGSSGMYMYMDGNVRFGKSIGLYDNTNSSNVQYMLSMYTSGNVAYINSSAHSMYLNFGVGGANETITTIGNASGNNYIQFDPTTSSGGTFTISAPTTTLVRGDMTLYKSLIDGVSQGVQGTLSNIGWYYLGQLGVGKTTIKCSLSWNAIVTYDGVSSRNTSIEVRERNDTALVIYKVGIAQYIFIYVYSAPVQIHVYESALALRLDQYEGSSTSAPNGSVSGYDSGTWVKDFDGNTAQGTSTAEIGTLRVNTSANITNLTTVGAVLVGGSLAVNGNTSYIGNDHLWQSSTGNLAEFVSDSNQNNSLTIYARDASSSTLNLNRTSQTASVSVSSLFALQNPGALTISHNTASSNSKIIFGTRAITRMVIGDAGQVTIQATTDTTGQNDGALVVFGGLQVSKSIVTLAQMTCPQLVLRNTGSGVLTTLSTTAAGDLYLGGKRIVSLGAPQNSTDAVTKGYVDLAVQGMSAKGPVVAASVGSNIDISSQVTMLDDVAIPSGSRFLIKDQTNPVENGIYVNGSPPTRASDMASGSHSSSSTVFVNQGTINANSGWLCNTAAGVDTVGVNALSFSQFSGAGQLQVGPGLTKNGNEIDLVTDNYSLEIALGALRVKSDTFGTGLSGGSGQPIVVSSIAHLDALGTINQGTWQADVIGMQYGGTGAASFNANSIPYSNGLQLTQGPFVFDGVNIRLGINTTTPTQGVTLVDRNILLSQTGSNPCYLITTSSASNFSFALRQSGSQLIWSSGTGQDTTNLTDRMFIDQTGVLNTTFGLVTPFSTVNTNYRFTGNAHQRLNGGVMNMSYYSTDNTGTYLSIYGGVGTFGSTSNSELMRVGYYNGGYIVATSATGTGVARSLVLQSGSNTNQVVLGSSGAVTINGALTVSSTTDATGITSGGAMTIAGGCAVNGTLYAQQLRITSSSGSAFSLAGGLSLSSTLSLVGVSTFTVSSSVNVSAVQVTSTTAGTPVGLNLSTYDANGTQDSKVRLFAVGSDQTTFNNADWLSVGFDAATSSYNLLVKAQTLGTLRGLNIGVGSTQLAFTSSDATLYCPLTTGYMVTIGATSDAASSTSGGALTVSGGLAVAKSLIVGVGATLPVVQVTDHQEFSQAGSIDRMYVRYVTSGNLHYYNTSSTMLYVHGGNSGGPSSSNQEYLSLGYLDSSHYSISTGHAGTGVLSALVLQSGSNSGQLVLGTSGNVSLSGALMVSATTASVSVTTGAIVTGGGVGIGGSMYVGGGVHIAAGTGSGTILSLASTLTTWTLGADTAGNRTVLKSAGGTDVFAIVASSSTLFTLDPSLGVSTLTLPTVVNASSTKAFTVQDGSAHDIFYIDTVNSQVNAGGCKIINLADPTVADGAATKRYVDNVAKGLNLKFAVNAASTVGTSVNLSNPLLTLDGVSLVPGYRVLLKDQSDSNYNGIYAVTTGNYLVRAADMAVGSRAAGAFCFVEQGTTHADTGYVCTTDYPNDIVATNPINFTQFNGNVVSAGLGLYKDANNVLNISLDTAAGLDFNAGALRIAPSFIGTGLQLVNGVMNVIPTSSLGTVTVGTWRATPVELGYGGTGNTNFTAGSIVFSTGTSLVGDASNFFWNSTKKALGLGTNLPDPNTQGEGLSMTKNLAIYSSTAGIYLGASAAYNWGIHRVDDGLGSGGAHLFFSGGASTTTTGGLSDVLVLTTSGHVGIGYSASSVASVSHTLDVSGTLHATGAVTFDTALTVASGGTGTTSLPYGLVIGHGSGALTTTGSLPDGGVAIGNSSGSIVVESGSTLRAHIGLAIGTNVQAWNTNLDVISGLSPSTNNFIMGNGTSFTTISGSALRTAIGLGALAVLSTINDTLWSGTQLSVTHGGTGVTSFTTGCLPYYDGTLGTMASSLVYWDSSNSGLGIGTNTVTVGNALHVYAADMAVQTNDNVNGNFGINFQNSNGQYVWRMRRQDAGNSNGSANLIFAGGAPGSSKTALVDRLALLTSGSVQVYSTIDSTSVGSGALIVGGGLGVAKTLYCGSTSLGGGHMVCNGSATVSTMTIQNGSSSGKSSIAFIDNAAASKFTLGYDNSASVSFVSSTGGLNVNAATTVTVTATTATTSTSSGALVVTGGLGVGASIYLGSNLSTSIPSIGSGVYLTVASGTTFTNTATASSGTSNDYNTVVFGQQSIVSSNSGVVTPNATTVYISGAPTAGTNTTINSRYAVWVAGGVSRFDGAIVVSNTTNSTGTGSGGALTVSGGCAVAKDFYIGGVITQLSGTSTINYLNTQNVTFTGTSTGQLQDGYSLQVAPSTVTDNVTTSGGTVPYASIQKLGSVALASTSTNVTVTSASTLHIVGAPSAGTNVTFGTTRAVHVEGGLSEFGGQVVVSNTVDSTSTTSGALVVSGGAAFAKSVYVGNDIHVAGTVWAPQNVSAPTITTGGLSNVGSVTVRKSKLVRDNHEMTCTVLFEVIPSTSSVLSSFTFTLPSKTSNLANVYDVITFTDGWTGGTSLTKVYNTVCAGVAGSTTVKVQFEAADSTSHYVSVKVEYNDS